MGAFGMCFFFDVERLETHITPALHTLADSGSWPQWCRDISTTERWQNTLATGQVHRKELQEALIHPALNARLSLGDPPYNTGFPVVDESLQIAVGELLFSAACGDGVYVAKSSSASLLGTLLVDAKQFEPNDPPVVLLEQLSRRLRVWTHATGGYQEGVHGWLSPEECQQFADALAQLELYRAAPGEKGFEEIAQCDVQEYLQILNDYGEGEDTRSMMRLEHFAKTAAARGQGMIWFNDPPIDGLGNFEENSVIWRRS